MDSRNFCNEILELINILKPLFHVGAFDEIHNMLMNRESHMTFEFGNLRKEMDMMTQRCSLVERRISQAEHEKSFFQWELKESRNEHKNLLLEMKKLKNTEILLREMLRKADERCAADQERHSAIVDERNQAISKLNAELMELKNCSLENQALATAEIAREVEKKSELKNISLENQALARAEIAREVEKLAADRTMNELRHKLCVADQTVERLNLLNTEASANVEKLVQEVEKLNGEKLAAEQKINELIEKLSEAEKTVERLRLSSTEASETIEGKRLRILEFDERQSMADKIIEELREWNLEDSVTIEELRSKQSTMDQTMEELRCQKLEAANYVEDLSLLSLKCDEAIAEMRSRQMEADKMIEDLRRQNLEAWNEVDDLRREKLKAEKIVELQKRRLEMLVPLTMEVKEILTGVLKTEDVANLLKPEERSSAAVLENANIPCSRDGKCNLENVGMLGANGDVDLSKRGSKNLPSLPSEKAKGEDDKNAESPFLVCSRSAKVPPQGENCNVEGKKKRKINMVLDSSEDELISDDDSTSSSCIDKLVRS